ncbi:membrane lipoprotein lipid attachment site-containing protein [Salinimicrobium sp. HB62]|uniref:membrane lipoprotein lipid attachment site-containing protein n=1 Tax=Salinimicrobium sp. HB62 TaxID=3077781 RepID=UPI002D7721D3|nr:membrane lipoprotein lipid attachment site-containing protein [Salinimicrobium sp. HB62]
MKKIFSAILLTILLASCSSESNSPNKETPVKFEVDLTPSSLSPDVDETAVVSFATDTPLSEIKWVRENSSRAYSAFDGRTLEQDIQLYFQFPFPGTQPVILEFKDLNGKVLKKELTFEVIPGNTVQITRIELIKFYDRGNAWDSEATGKDQLADLIFALEKVHQTGFVKNELRTAIWFISETHENESSLSWDLTQEDLYINPVYGFDFSLGDVDDDGMSQNLLLDRLSYKVELRDRIEARPETVELIDEAVDLHVVFHLNWPQQ